MESLEISRIVYAPGRDICGFRVKLLNVPGALLKVLKPLAERELNVLHVTVPPEIGKVGSCFFVIDCTNLSIEPEQLMKEFKETDVVLEAELTHPKLPGLIGDEKHFPLTALGKRAVIFREPVLKGLIFGARKTFGSAGEVFLYYAGRDIGKTVAKDYSQFCSSTADMAKALTLFAQTLGWGKPKIEEWNENELNFKLRFIDLWECKLGQTSDQGFSQLFRGIISGFFTALFGTDMEVKEASRISSRDSCTFIVQKKQLSPSVT